MGLVVFLLILASLFGLFYYAYKVQSSEERKVAAMSLEERTKYQGERAAYWRDRETSRENQAAESMHGPLNPHIICPHCQTKGAVRTMPVKKKAGISGGKATAALMTGGLSMFATGLSRKETLTRAHCENCNSTWSF